MLMTANLMSMLPGNGLNNDTSHRDAVPCAGTRWPQPWLESSSPQAS